MGWRGVGWGVSVAACLFGVARPSSAVELTRIELRPTPPGVTARLAFSAPLHVTTATAEGAATSTRLYVDLPRGTRLGRGVGRVAAVPPVAAVRVGLAGTGALRVVLDLEPGAVYELRQSGRAVTIALAAAAPAAPPVAPPAVALPRPPADVLRPKIVLDPGHGGSDPGAQGFAVEKRVTLDIARHLAALFRERLGADVVLTRSRDATLSLAARTARANAEGADLFLSIHANASRSSRLRGIETYYLNNTHDRGTIRLAAMENGLDMITPRRGRADLRYILSDLVQVGKMEESIALATAVQRGLVDHLAGRYRGVVDLGVKQGPFYVLVGAYMPCVLIETSFLTHPAEGRRLAGPAYREAVAEGIYAGVARFLADARRARTL